MNKSRYILKYISIVIAVALIFESLEYTKVYTKQPGSYGFVSAQDRDRNSTIADHMQHFAPFCNERWRESLLQDGTK